MPADKPLSEAWADLRLSDAKFNADLARAQQRLVAATKQLEAVARIDVTATLDTSKTKAQIEAELRKLRNQGGVVIPVEADTEPAQTEVAGLESAVAAEDVTVDVDADTTRAKAEIAALLASLKGRQGGDAFESIIIQVEARTTAIDRARESLQRLAVLAASVDNDDIVIDADLRDAGVRAELATIAALIEAITGQPANIDVNLDASAALAAFAQVQLAVETLSQEEIELKIDTTQAQVALATVAAGLSAFDSVTVQIDIRTAQINEAREALQRLAVLAASVNDQRIIIDPELRDAAVQTQLARISTLIAAISGEPANIDLDLDAAAALSQLAEIQVAVEALDGREIDLHLDVDGYAEQIAALRGIDAAANDTVDPQRGGIGRLLTALGFLGIGGVVGIGAVGAAITTFGVKASADLQGTIKSFENLLGSAEAADKLFKELQAFSIPSPFDTQVLATTTKSLLAIGVTAEEVIPTVKDLGAIVALLGGGSNDAFSRLTLALGQIRSAVKPLTQDLRQITSAIPGFNTEMQLAQGVAEKFGVSIAAAQDLIKDGAVTGEEAFQIILERMREFPGVAGAIEAAAGTLQGKLSAFADTAKQTLVNAFGGITTLVQDSLDPLQDAVGRALNSIAPQIATSLEGLIPAIPALVDSLGTGLGPAIAGIFTGLGGVLKGLTPIIERVLPLLAQIGPTLGDIAEDLGPVVADVGENLAGILIPALQLLADVLDVLPTEVLSTLLTVFIGFKAAQGVQGVFTGISNSLLELATRPGQLDGVTSAVGRLSGAARVAGPAVAGFFTGIGLAAEDSATKTIGAISSIGAIATGFAAGGPVGGAIASGTVVLGALVGEFQKGQREAKEMERIVKSLANVIKTEFPDRPSIDIGEALDTEGIQKAIEGLVGDKGLTAGLLELGVDLDKLSGHLDDSKDDFEAWLISLAETKLRAAGLKFDPGTVFQFRDGELQFQFLRQTSDFVAQAEPIVRDLTGTVNGLNDVYTELADSVVAYNQAQEFANAGQVDGLDAAARYEIGVRGVEEALRAAAAAQEEGFGLSAFGGPIKAASELRDRVEEIKAEIIEAGNPNLSAFGGIISASQLLEARLEVIPDDLEAVSIQAGKMADRFEREFGQAQDAVSALSDELSDMLGLLNTDLATQNFEADLQRFTDQINQVTNQDSIDAGLRIQEQIEAQRQRILDQQARLIDAQQSADLDAASLQDDIEQAEKVGAVNRAAELRRRLEGVYDDANAERTKLEQEYDKLRELQGKLGDLDLDPQRLIDQVRAQAQQSGLTLFDFLRTGTTDEALEANQQLIAPLVQSAIEEINRALDQLGPTAAAERGAIVEQQLIDALTPALGADTAQQIADAYLPPDTWYAQAQEAAKQAKEAAVAEFLATGQIPLSLDLDVDTQRLITALDVLKTRKEIPVGFDLRDLENAQLFLSTLNPTIKAQLGVDETQYQAQIEELARQLRRDGGDSFQTQVKLIPLTDDMVDEVEDLEPNVRVSLAPDSSPVYDALRIIENTEVPVKLIPDVSNEEWDSFRRIGVPAGAAAVFRLGGILDRSGRAATTMSHEQMMRAHIAWNERVMPLWARYGEPGTRGEAFIPFDDAPAQRRESERILRYVAQRFNLDVVDRATTNVNVAAPRVRSVSNVNVPPANVAVTAAPVTVSVPAADAPNVYVSVPAASTASQPIDVEAVIRTTIAAMLGSGRSQVRRPVTQSDYEGAVIVERIEQLVVGAQGAPARRMAFDFIDELRMQVLGL